MRMGPSYWGGGAEIGAVYVLKSKFDLERVGNCWADGKLKIGDRLLCIEKSGDCFYNYRLIETRKNKTRLIKPMIGAYQLGKKVGRTLSNRKFHLLLAGETIGK